MTGEFFVGPAGDPDLVRLGPAAASGSEGVLYSGWVTGPRGSKDVKIAVKMLQPGHLNRLQEWTRRWGQQVELLKRVKIPGLVAVRDGFAGPLPHPCGHADPSTASLYLLMDWVEGISLDRWARSVTACEPEQLLLSLIPVAVALDLLHSGAASKGVPIVHRDVKPANILIRPGGDTVLVDVGSVRDLSGDPRRSGVVGTPGYIAPEVRADAAYGPAADRYSLGAVAFFLLCGSEPPISATFEELHGLLTAAPLLEHRTELLEHVLAMLDPDPERRPTSLSNWVAQLRRSSLAMLPGDIALRPRAPSRHPVGGRLPHRMPGATRPDWSGQRWRVGGIVASTALLAGLTVTGSVVDRSATGASQPPRRPSATMSSGPPSTVGPRTSFSSTAEVSQLTGSTALVWVFGPPSGAPGSPQGSTGLRPTTVGPVNASGR